MCCTQNSTSSQGFTLLEVIVALAITGFILGSLFTLVAGSKQLSWRSEDSLIEATHLRAMTNFALLQNEYNEVEPIIENRKYIIEAGELLEDPERKTQASQFALEAFEVINMETDVAISGTRWIELSLPE